MNCLLEFPAIVNDWFSLDTDVQGKVYVGHPIKNKTFSIVQ